MVSFVRFQYPDEEIQQIEGDDYSIDTEYINTTEWQATGEAKVLNPNISQSKVGWVSNRGFTEKQGEITKVNNDNFFRRKIGESWLVGIRSCRVIPNLLGEWWKKGDTVASPGQIGDVHSPVLKYFTNPQFEPENKTYWYDKPIITYWHPVNGEREITLKILLKNSVVFSRAEIEKTPIFIQIIGGKECPPGTCPAKKQGKICCYNSQGVSVDSFLVEESIY